MPQKRRKSSLILSFLCPVSLIERINVAVAEQNDRTLKAPLTRSAWILRAIERDLDHTRRSRKDRGRVGVGVNDTMAEDRDGSCPVSHTTAWTDQMS